MTADLIKQTEQFLRDLEEKGIDVLKNCTISDIQPLLYDEGDKRNASNLFKSCEITKEDLHDIKMLGSAKELFKRRIAVLKKRVSSGSEE